MEKTLLNNCRFCKRYSQDHGTQGICTLMNVPVRGDWQACRMGVIVFTCEDRLAAQESMAVASAAVAYSAAQSLQQTYAQNLTDELWLTGSTHHSRRNTLNSLEA